jgi:alanine racemase
MMTTNLNIASPLTDASRLIAVIDLDAIIKNWKQMETLAAGATAIPVIKADAYGHGMIPVAKALFTAGCKTVFTATIDEAVTLAEAIPELTIAYFDGPLARDMEIIRHHGLVPVINSPAQLEVVAGDACRHEIKIQAMLHIDTGMNRLGFNLDETNQLFSSDDLNCADWLVVMSHLAMTDIPDDDMNIQQKSAFDTLLGKRPPALAKSIPSLSATGGVMLGRDYHYDLIRPGIGIFGTTPAPDIAPEMVKTLSPVLSLHGRVLQIRSAPEGCTVGYGKSHKFNRPSRLATLGGGYADGIFRQLSNQGCWNKDGFSAPIVGNVSMDVHVIDITDWPEDHIAVGDLITFISNGLDIHAIAKKTGTIAHDVFTRLGLRAKRHYAGNIVKKLDI